MAGAGERDSHCEHYGPRIILRALHGFPANRRWGKCAHSHRGAAAAVSFSPLRRELSRSHEHRLRDARDERRPGSDRFGVWHGERNFLHRIFRAANSRGAAGGTLEREAPARDNAHHLGRTHNAHRFRAHSAGTLRRAISCWARPRQDFFPA